MSDPSTRLEALEKERKDFFDFLERNSEEVKKMPAWVLEAHGIEPEPERATTSSMNLTTSESEVACLLHAAEEYSKARAAVGKPTSIIDTIIERLKMSPQNHDLVFVRRPEPLGAKCSANDNNGPCKRIAVIDGRCLSHIPKDPFK